MLHQKDKFMWLVNLQTLDGSFGHCVKKDGGGKGVYLGRQDPKTYMDVGVMLDCLNRGFSHGYASHGGSIHRVHILFSICIILKGKEMMACDPVGSFPFTVK